MHFREGGIKDAARLADVFFAAVREGPSPYTEAQRAAWLPSIPALNAFEGRISRMHLVVAEDKREIVGFIGMQPDGYIDLAFILPRSRRRGAFRHMYEIIEHQARQDGLERLRTHASLMAEPAFRAVGFSVTQQENVQRSGQTLARVEMEKILT
jgi:putative acetyltransferase